MSQYSSVNTTTRVNVTNGSAVVTGVDTEWVGEVSAGDGFTVVGTGVVYDVASVNSDTQITLSAPYSGATASNIHYTIHRDFTSPDNIPELNGGDIETATIMKRAMRVIQGKLNEYETRISDLETS